MNVLMMNSLLRSKIMRKVRWGSCLAPVQSYNARWIGVLSGRNCDLCIRFTSIVSTKGSQNPRHHAAKMNPLTSRRNCGQS
ncbi:hypothetical protein SADUNF_Sadunf15G0017800 [Salix dunnii]|uniref:Uncharacterized protein n=1 Tax=Salix dunnii TaxID=1413687 RepID=A0A835MI61_9ROSI|nr:hypothetical protein SADUNF_Sadunf15G0017800 [Salix dunnii]